MMPKNSRLQTLWTMFLCTLNTGKIIAQVFFFSYFGKTENIDKALHDWSQSLLSNLKVSWQVSNPHQIAFQPGRKYILMSNHASLVDIPLIFVSIPGRIRMLAKKELFRIPFFGHAMKKAGFPAIDRNNTEQALQDLAVVKEQMQQGIIPWIAPEGTRSRDGSLQRFKAGGFFLALQTGATIIPVGIRGAANIIPPDTFALNLGQQVEIILQPPIDASQYNVESRNQLIADVRQSIAQAIGEGEEDEN